MAVITVPVALGVLVVLAAAAILAAPKPGTQPDVKLPDLPKYEIKSWDEIKQDLNSLKDTVVGAIEACQEMLSKAEGEGDVATEESSTDAPPKGKRVETSKAGDKVRTPDSHPKDFKEGRNQTYTNKKTGERRRRAPEGTSHRGEKWDVTPKNSPNRVGDVRQNGEIARKYN